MALIKKLTKFYIMCYILYTYIQVHICKYFMKHSIYVIYLGALHSVPFYSPEKNAA